MRSLACARDDSGIRRDGRSPANFANLALVFLELCLNRRLDLFVERGIVLERVLGGIAALRELGALVAEPRAALLDDFLSEREIEQRAESRKCPRCT